MLVVPAIDLRGGACVRLVRGDPSQETVYSKDPVQIARGWAEKGATRLHVVDLDGALGGTLRHLELASQIRRESGVWVEFGGGIRRWEDVERCLDAGLDRIILGTAVLKDPELVRRARETYREKIMVGLDARGERIAVEGWTEDSPLLLSEAVRKVEDMGVEEIIFTDIQRDGTLRGPNTEAVRRVVHMSSLKIYASGGVGSLDDLKAIRSTGAAGCIVGKALYSGAFGLPEAIAASK